jgi:hypothetical protein
MTTPTPPIARLDTPLPVLEAAIRHGVLKQQAAAEEREALLAEQRHQYLDLDPDSVCCLPGLTCPACPPKTPGSPS